MGESLETDKAVIIRQVETILKKFPVKLTFDQLKKDRDYKIVFFPLDMKIQHGETFDRPGYLTNQEMVLTLPMNYNNIFRRYHSLKHIILNLGFVLTHKELGEEFRYKDEAFPENKIRYIENWKFQDTDFNHLVPCPLG